MHGDLTAFDARVAALDAAVAFTGVTVGGRKWSDGAGAGCRPLSQAEAAVAIEVTIRTAERFEAWLNRPEPAGDVVEPVPPLALGRTDD